MAKCHFSLWTFGTSNYSCVWQNNVRLQKPAFCHLQECFCCFWERQVSFVSVKLYKSSPRQKERCFGWELTPVSYHLQFFPSGWHWRFLGTCIVPCGFAFIVRAGFKQVYIKYNLIQNPIFKGSTTLWKLPVPRLSFLLLRSVPLLSHTQLLYHQKLVILLEWSHEMELFPKSSYCNV